MKKILFGVTALFASMFFVVTNPALASDCIQPLTCAEHCSYGWTKAEDRQACETDCLSSSHAEDRYKKCLKDEQEWEQRQSQQQQTNSTQNNQEESTTQTSIDNSQDQISIDQSVNLDFLKYSDIAVGKTITAPTDRNINIALPNGKIDVKAGSSLKNISNGVWEIIEGAFRFVVKLNNKLESQKFQVKNSNAVVSVRGTKFLMTTAPDNSMTVKVEEGLVSVLPNGAKKAEDVKKGYQITVDQKGATSSKKISGKDNWYKDIPGSPAFFEASWGNTANAKQYKKECVTTASPASPAEFLTDEEQGYLNSFNEALTKFKVKNTEALISDKTLTIFSEKTKTTASDKKSASFYMDSNGIYYLNGKKWESFQEKDLMNNLAESVKKDNITATANKTSFQFSEWKKDIAVYTGYASEDGNMSFIKGSFGSDLSAGQDIASLKVFIDEKSGLWTGYEMANDNFKSGKILIPIIKKCKIVYDDKVKIKIPKKSKAVDAEKGIQNLMNLDF